MIAAIYARKSTPDERSAADGNSAERQVSRAKEFASSRGWAVADRFVYKDEDVSGTVPPDERPGSSKLLKSRPPFGALVVMEQSRLARDTARALDFIALAEAAGVEVWSYRGEQITLVSESGEMSATLKALVDAAESRRASARTREALRKKMMLGHHVSGRSVAYGYDAVRVGEHSELHKNERQARVVSRIFRWSSEGDGDLVIAKKLNDEKIPAPGPKKTWSKESVKRILRCELYRGVYVGGRSRPGKVVDGGGRPKRARVAVPKDDWIVVEVARLRIVTDELWRAVQDRKERTRRAYLRTPTGQLLGRPESGVRSKHLLTGFLRCPACGGPMLHWNHLNARSRYRCIEHLKRGTCDESSGPPARELERAVQVQLNDMLLDEANWPKYWDLLLERSERARAEKDDPKRVGERDRLRLDEERLAAQVERLTDALESGQPVGDRLRRRAAELETVRLKLAEMDDLGRPRECAEHEDFWAEGCEACDLELQADWEPFERLLEENRRWLKRNGPLVNGDPAQVRQVMRKLGVERVIISRQGRGWRFEGAADLAGLISAGRVNRGGSGSRDDSLGCVP